MKWMVNNRVTPGHGAEADRVQYPETAWFDTTE
jgi:hypothetical protein